MFNFKILKDGKEYDMHELDLWVNHFHIHSPSPSMETIKVPGKDGEILSISTMDVRNVEINITVTADSVEELDDKKHFIYELFYSTTEYKIVRDFKNTTINVIQDGSYHVDNITCSDGEFTISLKMLDPYLYRPEKTRTGVNSLAINNEGGELTYPRIKIDVKKDATFIAVSNGNQLNMIGNYVDADQGYKPFKREERVFWDEMGSTVSWSNSTTVEEGTISGTMLADGYSFYASDYGDDSSNWHGPAKKKAIGGTLQDFQVDAILRQQGGAGQVGSVEVLLLDVQNRVVGKIVLSKRSSYNMAVHARIRAGNEQSGHNIMNSRGQYDWVWASFSGVLKIGRIGDYWYAHVIADDGKGSLYREWTDRRGIAKAPIAQVQVQIWKYGSTPASSVQSIDDVKVFKINSQEDGIPYIATAEDVIEFDHVNDVIYKNGQEIMKEKAFIGEFFGLYPGSNGILTEPKDAIGKTEVIYTERDI